MKAMVNKESWKITLDNEAVKAIRFCYGFNTDLRISIKNVPKDDLWHWLDNNRFALFGSAIADMKPSPLEDDFLKYEHMINDVVRQILK